MQAGGFKMKMCFNFFTCYCFLILCMRYNRYRPQRHCSSNDISLMHGGTIWPNCQFLFGDTIFDRDFPVSTCYDSATGIVEMSMDNAPSQQTVADAGKIVDNVFFGSVAWGLGWGTGHRMVIMNFIFCKLKNLKKHEFHFLQT